jgi:hypothetical protein
MVNIPLEIEVGFRRGGENVGHFCSTMSNFPIYLYGSYKDIDEFRNQWYFHSGIRHYSLVYTG